ncbi:nitroreductase family protein [Candidatus Woesearchaeota archaeon]|nr:nitroreductase family protein [Candidatus Woesearchaeota archaeon]
MQQTNRKSAYLINSLILNRWSPRAMSGASLTDEELMPLFEAARWAPSSYNNQPWRFLYAKRDTKHWKVFFDLLVEFNQSWCKNAAVLVVIIAKKNFEHNGQPSVTHQYDTGAAWENLALEGSANGLVVHGMQGFDYEKARKDLNIPNEYTVLAMAAIGKPAEKESLPEGLAKIEVPSDRKPLKEIVMEGEFREEKTKK